MRILIILLVVMLAVLQYRLWVGEGSLAELHLLKEEIELQKGELQQMRRRNQSLQAEVDDLKKGLEAIEERARNDLGMIREGEIFYQMIEPEK
ncbi:MAG: cell division protein FtsB, partial [Sedimenticola sp.]|nr:cell division protein FtsB [Sedimenticola sp.]